MESLSPCSGYRLWDILYRAVDAMRLNIQYWRIQSSGEVERQRPCNQVIHRQSATLSIISNRATCLYSLDQQRDHGSGLRVPPERHRGEYLGGDEGVRRSGVQNEVANDGVVPSDGTLDRGACETHDEPPDHQPVKLPVPYADAGAGHRVDLRCVKYTVRSDGLAYY